MQIDTSTAEGTGSTVLDASSQIASLLSGLDEGDDTQGGSEAAADTSDEEEVTAEGDEGAEGEENGDDESESDEEDDGQQQPQEIPDDYKVKVGDEEITLHELKRGFLRESDYTRKTQALADERRNHQTAAANEMQALQGERAQLAQAMGQVQQYMQELTPKEPDWDSLYRENPAEYAAQRELWRSWQEQQYRLNQSRQQLAAKSQQEQEQQLKQYIGEQKAALLKALPEWSKPEVVRVEKPKMLEWAEKNGFTAEEFSSIIDHRALVTARKAMLYDELMAKQKTLKPVAHKKGAPKTAVPGTAASSPAQGKTADATRAKQRLAKTGRVNDAAAALMFMLPDE